jgi:hypothetical protein
MLRIKASTHSFGTQGRAKQNAKSDSVTGGNARAGAIGLARLG